MNVKFGDVVKEVKSNVDRANNPYEFYVAGDHMDSEDFRIHRHGCFATDDVGPAFVRIFHPGQVLYGSRRTYLKKVCVADFEGICANTTFVLETKDENVLIQRLLPFLMLSNGFTEWSIKHSKGSTNPYVLFSDLAGYEFDLPPMDEQKKLAELLWAANDLKEKYKKAITTTDEMLKAKFREMFGDAGDDSSRGDAETRSQLTERNLGDLASFITSGSRGWAKYYAESGSYFITIKNIRGGKIRLDNMDYVVPPNDMEAQRTKVQYNDLLISITADLGRTAVVSKEIADYGAYINQHISCVRLNSDVVDPFYASYYLESDMGKQQFQLMNQKSVKAGLNFDAVKAIKILLPPLSLQREFVAIADKAESTKANLNKSIAAIDQVMKGLINS